MKKNLLIILILLIIASIASYYFLEQKAIANEIKDYNAQFEALYDINISGSKMASSINKAINENKNNENKIEIEIKFIDSEDTFKMEDINNGGMNNFLTFYNDANFKCTKIDYENKYVSYMYFEEIE